MQIDVTCPHVSHHTNGDLGGGGACPPPTGVAPPPRLRTMTCSKLGGGGGCWLPMDHQWPLVRGKPRVAVYASTAALHASLVMLDIEAASTC